MSRTLEPGINILIAAEIRVVRPAVVLHVTIISKQAHL
jgi:hypothetical protein